MADLKDFCDLFYASHYIPIGCICENEMAFMTGFPEFISTPCKPVFFSGQDTVCPAVISDGDLGFYGIVKSGEQRVVLGPVFGTTVSQDMVRLYMKENVIPYKYANDVYEFLARIPRLSYNQFFNLISFLNYVLNSERTDLMSRFSEYPSDRIAFTHQEAVIQNREEQITHGTYLFEQQMLDYIRSGNAERLQDFLLQAAGERQLNEGMIGDSPLRQAKNIMQGLISLVGKAAAIPGGMDVERAYQLMDSYGMECERQRSVDAVTNLQFQMVIDFARRVGQSKQPTEMTPEIYACTQYINAHINAPIEVDEIAEYIGRSRSYITTHFRRELGCSVAEYITKARIREAKSLLRFSDKTLGEISEYLCFSSQPHFQRVFKQATGMTPTEYRRRGDTVKKM